MKATGNLVRNGRVLVRGTTVQIRVQGKRWSGELDVPKDSNLFSGSYDLRLNDGRGGRITIGVIQGEHAFFDGEGELKKQ